MMISRKLRLLSFLLAISSCGDTKNTTDLNLPTFFDLSEAPVKIQNAAKAVVRIETKINYGTGSFISDSGLLLTNDHVLGGSVCAIEGCWVKLSFNYQIDMPFQQPIFAYAVPVSVDAILDMAIVQIFENPTGPKLKTSNYLDINSRNLASLLGTHVTVVGHPKGRLKKWSDGFVYNIYGDWFYSTGYALPGDSGSPVLDDNGKIVGLLHRSANSLDIITSEGINVFFVGTASESLLNARDIPQLSSLISVAESTTNDSALTNNLIYLNAGISTVLIDTSFENLLSLLAQACDIALAHSKYLSIDEFDIAIKPCKNAFAWIECRADVETTPYGKECPTDVDAWRSRFMTIANNKITTNNLFDLYFYTDAVIRLEQSVTEGKEAARQNLEQVLVITNPTINYFLTSYLAYYEINSYAGIDIIDYVQNYKNVLHYKQQASTIALTAQWLYQHSKISSNVFFSLLSDLHKDNQVSVGDKLFIEELEYIY
ncbi:MAG: trypsin-like peptidase domain-containing protein [Deltaproteobacteria bacterium]|nr:trypsin-like peptidase domain-containing protein [Deltaproteobacteria bacterium]